MNDEILKGNALCRPQNLATTVGNGNKVILSWQDSETQSL